MEITYEEQKLRREEVVKELCTVQSMPKKLVYCCQPIDRRLNSWRIRKIKVEALSILRLSLEAELEKWQDHTSTRLPERVILSLFFDSDKLQIAQCIQSITRSYGSFATITALTRYGVIWRFPPTTVLLWENYSWGGQTKEVASHVQRGRASQLGRTVEGWRKTAREINHARQ